MSKGTWRPLGVDTEDEIANYDALHDGVPNWLQPPFWAWVTDAVTQIRRFPDGSGRIPMLDTDLAEQLCQTLKIPLPNLRERQADASRGQRQLKTAMEAFGKHPAPLQIVDYLLAYGQNVNPDALSAVLERGKSAWVVGVRSGKPGLVRRVPIGVQIAADSIMATAGRAGMRLAEAWEELYGVAPNASAAYRLAILAVEDAAVPVVSPKNTNATLGTVLKQIEDQKDWKLPMDREHANARSREVLVAMMRMLWHGQHDRHGGQPSAPGNVSEEEATVAVSLAVTLVQWFDASLIRRSP